MPKAVSLAFCVAVTALLSLPALAATSFPSGIQGIPGHWQLFVDDHLIASKNNVKRAWHAIEKYSANPIMKVDQPWEYDVITATTVLPAEDGSGYRMWYYCWSRPDDTKHGGYALYATSTDGIQWEKPKLGVQPFHKTGSKDTNIVEAGGSIMFTPEDPDPSRRYKAISPGEFRFSSSPDGIRWEKLSKDRIFSAGDTGHLMWDTFTGKYRGYAKINATVTGQRRRAIGYSEGAGFESWPAMRLVMAPDDFDDRWVKPGSVQRTHMYNCPVMIYQDMYIGLLVVYRADDDEGYFHGPLFVEVVSSRDGFHWIRQDGDRNPLVPTGPERTWDHGMVFACSIVPVGDKLRVYYSGYDGLHDYLPFHAAIGFGDLRRDGFASMDGGDVPGEFVTKRLSSLGGKLHLNYAADNGLMQVEVLDASGKVIEGYHRNDCDKLRKDSVDEIVSWRGKQVLPKQDSLRFRFILRNASIYSFYAGDSVQVIEDPKGPVLAALYSFEGDGGRQASDKLAADGKNELRFLGTSKVDRGEKNAAFGRQSLTVSSPWRPLNRLQIAGTSELGRHFSLAVMAKIEGGKPARLFSSYNGNKPIGSGELVFDCDPRGRAFSGLRLYCKGIPVESKPVEFADDKYHHLAVTWDDGHVRFWLDGNDAGEAWLPGGMPVSMLRDLMIGEDLELGSEEQFIGNMDDVLVIGRVLKPEEIKSLATKGAEATELVPSRGR